MTAAALEVAGLSKHYKVRGRLGFAKGYHPALQDVSFTVEAGDVLGIVGESGSGKSTLGKTLVGATRPTTGSVKLFGTEISGLTGRQQRAVRKDIQYIYQDSGAALDPRWKIRRSLLEPLTIHTILSTAEREQRIAAILAAVGLPAGHLNLYPHEMSGGQQRRAGLARVLVLNPKLVILDEPTSGLDVSVQATILKLLLDIRRRFQLTYLFISHDLAVVRFMCDRIAVMNDGRIVEMNAAENLFQAPCHPYTRKLLAAVPRIGSPRLTDVTNMTDATEE